MSDSPSTILRWPERARQALPGITASVALGQRLSAAMFVLGPGAIVPEHSHDNEEFGQVIRGSLELTFQSQTVVLGAGEAFLLPADVIHSARAGAEGCELLECYAPPRDPVPTRPDTGVKHHDDHHQHRPRRVRTVHRRRVGRIGE